RGRQRRSWLGRSARCTATAHRAVPAPAARPAPLPHAGRVRRLRHGARASMTTTQQQPILERLRHLPAGQAEELACAAHLGVWTQRRRGLAMSPLHWEWAELAMNRRRLALVAPREHGKSEALSVRATPGRCTHQPRIWSYLCAQTADQAEALLGRTRAVIEEVRPELVEYATTDKTTRLVLGNGSRVDCAGAGKRVRGAHPDVI